MIVETFFESIALALITIFVIMCLVFKSFKYGLFAMLPNTLPLVYGLGCMSLFGDQIDVSAVLVCCVCLGIAVDDTIHFLVNFFRNKQQGKSSYESLELVLSLTGKALIVTTINLVIGFGIFYFGDFVPNQIFGIYSSLVLLFALLVDLMFVPSLILLLKQPSKNS